MIGSDDLFIMCDCGCSILRFSYFDFKDGRDDPAVFAHYYGPCKSDAPGFELVDTLEIKAFIFDIKKCAEGEIKNFFFNLYCEGLEIDNVDGTFVRLRKYRSNYDDVRRALEHDEDISAIECDWEVEWRVNDAMYLATQMQERYLRG